MNPGALDHQGGAHHLENFAAGISPAMADTGTLICNRHPAVFRPQVAEPEGECPALMGAPGIDAATVVEKQTAAVGMFADAVAVFIRVQVAPRENIYREAQMVRQGPDFICGHVYRSGLARAAPSASAALEANTVIEKIGTSVQ